MRSTSGAEMTWLARTLQFRGDRITTPAVVPDRDLLVEIARKRGQLTDAWENEEKTHAIRKWLAWAAENVPC